MTSAAPTKNGNGTANWIKGLFLGGAFVAGALVGVLGDMKTDPQARPDAYTMTDHNTYARTHEEGHEYEGRIFGGSLEALKAEVDRLVIIMERHALLDMHAGAALRFAALSTTIEHLSSDMAHVKKTVDEIQKKVE